MLVSKIIAHARENEQSVIQTLTIAMLFPLSKIWSSFVTLRPSAVNSLYPGNSSKEMERPQTIQSSTAKQMY